MMPLALGGISAKTGSAVCEKARWELNQYAAANDELRRIQSLLLIRICEWLDCALI